MDNKQIITVEIIVNATPAKVWKFYTEPEHIVNWNFASDDWHCPNAENDLRPGGIYKARMEAKDGSFGFDFESIYNDIQPDKLIAYTIADGRKVKVIFISENNITKVITEFEAENQNPAEMQQQGWQAILNNFKRYVENN